MSETIAARFRLCALVLVVCVVSVLPANASPGMSSAGEDPRAGSQQPSKQESRQHGAQKDRSSGKSPRETEGEKSGSQRGEEEDVPVFTNADLERLFGPPPPESRKTPATPLPTSPRRKAGEGWGERPEATEAPDPLKQLEAELAREQERKKKIRELQKEVARLEARLKELRERKLRIENPFLPRPVLRPEELETWKKLDNVGRLRLTNQQIQETQRRLDELRRELEALQRSAPPA